MPGERFELPTNGYENRWSKAEPARGARISGAGREFPWELVTADLTKACQVWGSTYPPNAEFCRIVIRPLPQEFGDRLEPCNFVSYAILKFLILEIEFFLHSL